MAIQGECNNKQYIAMEDIGRILIGCVPIVENGCLYVNTVIECEHKYARPIKVKLTEEECAVCEPVLTEDEQILERLNTLEKKIDLILSKIEDLNSSSKCIF